MVEVLSACTINCSLKPRSGSDIGASSLIASDTRCVQMLSQKTQTNLKNARSYFQEPLATGNCYTEAETAGFILMTTLLCSIGESLVANAGLRAGCSSRMSGKSLSKSAAKFAQSKLYVAEWARGTRSNPKAMCAVADVR